jgi:hypothetical protein
MKNVVVFAAIMAVALWVFSALPAGSEFLISPKDTNAAAIDQRLTTQSEVNISGAAFSIGKLKTEGITLMNRSDWINKKLDAIILPNIRFERENLHECLEFLRRAVARALMRMEEGDSHIHFLRLDHTENPYPVTLSAKDLSIRRIIDEIAKQNQLEVVIVDYGVILMPHTAPKQPRSNEVNPF